MIGVFDSGLGGLTVLRALVERFPNIPFLYLGDHANVPYGNRPSQEIVDFTRAGVEWLFQRGCRLVLLGCNTATAVAARPLQQQWLPRTGYKGHNVLGIVAPTVEAATQTPWAVTTPQYPQKYNSDLIFVFGTTRTITSDVYPQEIRKRCPRVRVVQQICAELAGAIEEDRPEAHLDALVRSAVREAVEKASGLEPDRVILGCSHFPLVEGLFRRHVPPSARLLSQPRVVADSLEDYLARHPEYATSREGGLAPALVTTGEPNGISKRAKIFWPEVGSFVSISDYPGSN
jgi:glutamate racemase